MAAQPNRAGQGLSAVLAVIATVFVVPHVWPVVDDDLRRALFGLYSPDIAAWLHLGGRIAIWPLCFVLIRAGLTALFAAVLLLFMQRLR